MAARKNKISYRGTVIKTLSKTTVLYMDKNRNVISRDVVMDKGTCISLFLGISM